MTSQFDLTREFQIPNGVKAIFFKLMFNILNIIQIKEWFTIFSRKNEN